MKKFKEFFKKYACNASAILLTAVYDAQRSPFCFRTAVFRSQRPPIFS